MRKTFIVVGLHLLCLAALAVAYARQDPIGALDRFDPALTRVFESDRGLWVREYTFAERSTDLYEYLEAHRGEDWSRGIPVAYSNGWRGHFDPIEKTLTVIESIQPSLWDEIKEALGFGMKGCG